MALASTLTGREAIWLVRGLSFVLAGLLTALAGVVLTQLPTAMVWSGRLLWLVTAGAWLIVFGAVCLNRLSTPGARAKAAAQRCLWLALVTAFLAPFAYFWHRAPWRDYLTANVLLLLVCSTGLLLCMNRLVWRLGEFFQDETLAVTARVSRWVCWLLVVFPGVAILSGLGVGCWYQQLPFFDALGNLLGRLGPWAKTMALAPACLTAALLWTLKAVGLAQIGELGKPTAMPSEQQDRDR